MELSIDTLHVQRVITLTNVLEKTSIQPIIFFILVSYLKNIFKDHLIFFIKIKDKADILFSFEKESEA